MRFMMIVKANKDGDSDAVDQHRALEKKLAKK